MFNPPQPTLYFPIVWLIVRQIPEGKVSTYGQIASMIPLPEGANPESYHRLAPRWVGTGLRRTPDQPIPWQRVINSQGRISLPEGSENAEKQRIILEHEGIVFIGGKVNLVQYGWQGPSEAWLAEHDLNPPRLFI